MTTWVALLRGVNVGGNRIRMAELREEIEALGLGIRDVRTYIQSGNVVFGATPEAACQFAALLPERIEGKYAFAPRVVVLAADELRRAADANPFGDEAADLPKSVHAYFLADRPAAPDTDGIEAVCAESERWHLADRVFYLHAPEGVWQSKLAPRVEKLLGVDATARNWRTVTKLRAMVDG